MSASHPPMVRWSILAALLAVAAAVRLPGITNGLPDYTEADEPVIYRHALRVAQGRFNPHFFDWPGNLQIYVNGAVYYSYYNMGKLTGRFAPDQPIKAAYAEDRARFCLLSRLVNVACALALVAVVFQATVGSGLLAAGVAALFVGLAPAAVRESTAAMTDVPATLLLTLALVQSSRLVRQPSPRGFLLGGLVVGLGTAIKYYACVAAVAVAVAVWLAPRPRRDRLRLAAIGVGGMLLGFVIGCPYSVLAFDEFRAAVSAQFEHQSSGHVGADRTGWPIWSYVSTQLAPAATLPLLLAGCAGACLAIRRRRAVFYPVLACAVAYLVCGGMSKVTFQRYAMPHIPMLAMLAAPLLDGHWAARLSRYRHATAALRVALAVLLLVLPALGTTAEYRKRQKVNIRQVAAEWLRSEIPSDARVAQTIYVPRIPGARYISPHIPVRDDLASSVRRAQFDYVVLDASTTDRMYLPASLEKHPEIVESHLALYGEIERRYELRHVFFPGPEVRGSRIFVYIRRRDLPAGGGLIPVAGDWNGDGIDTPGLYDPFTCTFSLFSENTDEAARLTVWFELMRPGHLPIVGDWDGDGIDNLGLFDPEAARFLLKNENTDGGPDHVFRYGPAGTDWFPLAGDWDGDGKATVALYVPEAGRFLLKNNLQPGRADARVRFGRPDPNAVPLIGDWTGEGFDCVGFFDPAASRFFLSNRATATVGPLAVQFASQERRATTPFRFARGGLDWVPIAGDWDGDGIETVGLYDPAGNRFFLRNQHAPGPADVSLERLPD